MFLTALHMGGLTRPVISDTISDSVVQAPIRQLAKAVAGPVSRHQSQIIE